MMSELWQAKKQADEELAMAELEAGFAPSSELADPYAPRAGEDDEYQEMIERTL